MEPFLRLAEGELALAENRTEDAIGLLEQGLEALRPTGHPIFFQGAEGLARALEKKGSLPQARRVLQDAAQQKRRTLDPKAKADWLPVQAHLARVSRQLGLEDEARQIEDELRRLLAHADPDFAILRQLEARSPASGP